MAALTATPSSDGYGIELVLDWTPRDYTPPDPQPLIGDRLGGQGLTLPALTVRKVRSVEQNFALAERARVYAVRLYVGTVSLTDLRLRLIGAGSITAATADGPPVEVVDGWALYVFNRATWLEAASLSGTYVLRIERASAPGVALVAAMPYTAGPVTDSAGLWLGPLTSGTYVAATGNGDHLPLDGRGSTNDATLAFYLYAAPPPPPLDDSPKPPTVSRLDPDGVWRAVRAGNPVTLVDGTSWTAVDYEAPFDRPVTYVATTGDDRDDTLTSDLVSLPGDGYAWLRHLTDPSRSRRVHLTAAPDLDRASKSGSYPVLGRSRPVATTDARQAATGSLTVYTGTRAERDDLLALLDDGTVLQLAMPDSSAATFYLLPGDLSEKRIGGYGPAPERLFSLDFAVVERPA